MQSAICKARIAAGLSQEELAALIGVSDSYISRIERGVRAPKRIVKKINEVLGIEVVFDPIPMLLTCPSCGKRHIDVGEFATKPHHTHACQHCGMCWRPAIVPTVGVQFLPGFKNEE